jgi:hypothetical protein
VNLDILTAWVTIFGVIAGIASVVIALVGVKREREWNRRINAEETLTKLVNERFGELLVRIEQDFGWSIVNDKRTYEDVTRDMKEGDVKELDRLLRKMLRILETIGIYIKHGLIDDDMVYDYLASIGPKIQERCQSFIDKERELREEPRVFEVFSETVKRWQAKDRARQSRRT